MSLSQMQAALVMLVRYPTAFQGEELAPFLKQFILTDTEKSALAQLAENRELGKFGFGIQDMRWDIIKARMPLVQKVVPAETLQKLFHEGFDPISHGIPNRELPHEFLSFLEQDEEARRLLDAIEKPALWDFVQFEKAQVRITLDRWTAPDAPAESSPLATRAFYLCDFSHDVPTYLVALEEAVAAGESSHPEPQPVPTQTLLIASDELPGYRLFVLEAETFAFLQAALDGENPETLPSTYGELVEAGLCKRNDGDVAHAVG